MGLAAIAVLSIASTSSAATILIDDFSVTQSISDAVGGGVTISETNVAGVLGGVRLLRSEAGGSDPLGNCFTRTNFGGSGEASESCNSRVVTGNGYFYYDGANDGGQDGTGGALNIDLTDGGQLDRFRLEVTSISSGNFAVAVFDSVGTASQAVLSIPATGTYDLLFSGFSGSVDFTDIRAISLRASVLPNETLSFSSFSVVPEPFASLLVATGLLGFAARWRLG
jgi:hypothetical protein